MAQRTRSARDELYLNSPGFEVYMVAGTVFVVGFTVSFILSVLAHREVMLWPGALLSVVVAGWVLRVLIRRERAAKLRELETEYARRDAEGAR